MDGLERITFDPLVMGGKPCIREMRVTVGTIVGLVASGYSSADILQAYPYLTTEDFREALAHAAWRVEDVELRLARARSWNASSSWKLTGWFSHVQTRERFARLVA